MRDSERLASIRQLHARAGGVVEHAWRESVQLAAEELGGGVLGADSEGMSRAAEKYKKMRQQIQNNLDRLTKLETACGGGVASRSASAADQPAAEPSAAQVQSAVPTPEPARAKPSSAEVPSV